MRAPSPGPTRRADPVANCTGTAPDSRSNVPGSSKLEAILAPTQAKLVRVAFLARARASAGQADSRPPRHLAADF